MALPERDTLTTPPVAKLPTPSMLVAPPAARENVPEVPSSTRRSLASAIDVTAVPW